MKKWLLPVILMSSLSLTVNACSPDDAPSGTETPIPTPRPEPNPNPDDLTPQPGGNNRALVVYFSCTNTTKEVSEQIASLTGSSMYRIEPEAPYTSADLDYNDSSSRANREQNDPSARPAIANSLEGLSDYDVIFLGYPIWWGKAPKIIFTFLESHDFAGKIIVPFCTSHSSGIGSSDTELHASASQATWKQGRRFGGNTSGNDVVGWIESLDLNFNANADVGSFDLAAGVNGKVPTVWLSSGYDMPILGLGTYSLRGDICVNSVKSALARGFRKFDTASIYGNEEEVGQGVRESGVPREEIFVATKLYPNQYADAEEAIEECLRKLGIGYIDLMLLHHPGRNDVTAYQAMERAVAAGKIRSLGLSNYYVEEMSAFLTKVAIKPVLVQNEIHPYYQENDVIPYMHEQGIVVEAWYPFGGRGHTAEMFADETISSIAKAHGKSPAQVILRWDLQKGVAVIPGSSDPDHIQENISVFDFELTDEEMAAINALDRNEKHDWY